MNKIVQISKRAKAIRKAKPSIKWQTAIKQASKELKGKSVGAVRLVKKTRVIKVKSVSGKRKARGKRVASPAMGSHNVTGQLSQEISRRNAAENALSRLRSTSTAGMSAQQKSARKREITYQQKAKQVHAKNIVNLKRLI